MSIVRFNPWREFDDIFTNMAALPSENLSRSEWLPAVDISETDNEFKIDVEIPAIARDDINVSVKDGVLTVTESARWRKIPTARHIGWNVNMEASAVASGCPRMSTKTPSARLRKTVCCIWSLPRRKRKDHAAST